MAAVNQTIQRFDVADYLVFGFMLSISAGTGIWFGCRHRISKKHSENVSVRDYLTGEGKMSPFPVAMSLVASYISGVTMLGTPAEVYNFGTMYWYITFAIWLSAIIISFVYLPVFHQLKVLSSYEYLEHRFDHRVRTVVSFLFLLDELMFLPIVVYIPSLAFNQVSGVNLYVIAIVTTVVCIFYTTLGGLRAVVYTDTWQILTMFFATLIIAVIAVSNLDGGVEAVWETARDHGRLAHVNMDLNFYERYTFFSVLIGGCIYWMCFNSVNQTMVQRYMSVSTLVKSEISFLMFIVGVSLFISLCCFCGLLIFHKYAYCDPLESGRCSASDQMFPLYVVETVGQYGGISGLFIAGVFGASLSSLSVILNSTSVVFIEDFLKAFWVINLSERQMLLISKTIVITLGCLSVASILIVQHLGGVLAMATSLSGIAAGTTCGIFTLGMLVPWATTKGAIYGGLAGFFASGFISYGTQFAIAYEYIVPHTLPVSVDKCYEDYGINVTYVEPKYPDESKVFPLFRLGYLWITPVGFITVLVVGIIVSIATGTTDLKKLDPLVIAPFLRRFLPKEAEFFSGTSVTRTRARLGMESEFILEGDELIVRPRLLSDAETDTASRAK